jgi:hypothetical protein
MFLGCKDDSSVKWCWLCELSHKSWQKEGHEQGHMWTLEELIADADRWGENKSVKGVKRFVPYLTVSPFVNMLFLVYTSHLVW